ncbi:hypothetical protein DID88_000804 [Monilinia fructigena]|uniref:AB hydrolase-1 domain-containing protein n=1 Tax=Monilinia fructigena TaxID=38457 RepID=A0A395IIV9_9HELO|nr:hypothetical protein DID88_000804 [Monilinia fructigena]
MSPRLLSPTLLRACRRNYSTSSIVPLAFDLHEPAKASSTAPRAIIFMHGLFGSKKNNRSISKALARDLGRPVYAVDLRKPWRLTTSPQTRLHGHGSRRHSMGAKTAMALALQSPEMVEDIVSVDNAPIDAALLSNFAKYIQGMKKIEEAGVSKQTEADKILQDYEEELPIRQFLLGNLMRTEDKTQKFKVPLKILGGALDNLGDFPFKDPDSIRFNKPTLFELADIDAGHWVVSEKPEEFRQEFLTPKE